MSDTRRNRRPTAHISKTLFRLNPVSICGLDDLPVVMRNYRISNLFLSEDRHQRGPHYLNAYRLYAAADFFETVEDCQP